MSDDTTFNYTYSATRQDEIDAIRRKYLPEDEDAMERLRRLDRGTAKRGTAVAIVLGAVGCLLLGVGMSCTLAYGGPLFIPGIVVGAVGIAMMAAAYPAYRWLTARDRAKAAPEILRLAEELSGPRE